MTLFATVISIVLPIYNEEEGLSTFLQNLEVSLLQLNLDFEVILVNDGSSDNSLQIIETKCLENQAYRYINLSRNFGHQIAISAGIDYASGDKIVLMDSDGQDPPEEIANLVSKLNEGYDMVYAKRAKRENESFLKKTIAKFFYGFLNKITNVEIPVDTGDFRILNRKVADAFKQMPEKQRYLRGQIAWLGFKQTFITYDRKGRNAGETHYTYRKMFRLAIDAITSFSNWPLRVATLTGFFLCHNWTLTHSLYHIQQIYFRRLCTRLGIFNDNSSFSWRHTTAFHRHYW